MQFASASRETSEREKDNAAVPNLRQPTTWQSRTKLTLFASLVPDPSVPALSRRCCPLNWGALKRNRPRTTTTWQPNAAPSYSRTGLSQGISYEEEDVAITAVRPYRKQPNKRATRKTQGMTDMRVMFDDGNEGPHIPLFGHPNQQPSFTPADNCDCETAKEPILTLLRLKKCHGAGEAIRQEAIGEQLHFQPDPDSTSDELLLFVNGRVPNLLHGRLAADQMDGGRPRGAILRLTSRRLD